jgi:hypothetical protein
LNNLKEETINLDKRVDGVENRVWWIAGLGLAVVVGQIVTDFWRIKP